MSRRAGGRAARQAARLQAVVESVPYLTRTLAPVEVLSDEGLALLEENADTILEQVGIEFRDAPDAITLLRDEGAEVEGVVAVPLPNWANTWSTRSWIVLSVVKLLTFTRMSRAFSTLPFSW